MRPRIRSADPAHLHQAVAQADGCAADGFGSRSAPTRRWPLRKYGNILRVALIERMAYRGDFLLGSVLRFLPMVTTILLWQAIYAGSGQAQLGGFSYRE